MLEHEADEDVVERLGRHREQVGLPELDVGELARGARPAIDSAETSIDVKRAFGLRADSVTVCAPTPQPASSTRAAGRVARVAVQQLDERAGLVVQRSLSRWSYPWT